MSEYTQTLAHRHNTLALLTSWEHNQAQPVIDSAQAAYIERLQAAVEQAICIRVQTRIQSALNRDA